MAKRIAGSELNDRNWDDEEEPEEAGIFIQASKDVMEQRAIKKAKRRVAGDNSGSKAGAFSGFGGFGGFGLKTPTPTTKDMFSGFKKLDSASTPSKPGIFGGTSSVNGSEDQKSKGSGDSKESSQYLSSLKSLNESVLAWIKQHVDTNPFIILTPIFRDYEKHLQMIQAEKSPASSTSLAKEDEEDNQSSGLASSISIKVTSVPATTSASKPDDDKEKQAEASKGKAFTFGQTSAAAPALGFSFAASAGSTGNAVKFTAPNSSSLTGFSFSQNKSETSSLFGKSSLGSATSSQGLFSFGAATTSQGSTSKEGSQDTNEKDEEDYEPPKPEVKEIVESDALCSKRCKLYYQKDGQWVDRGVGNLHLKPVADNKTQLLIRADTNLGNILLNVMLSSTMPVSRQGKNNLLVVCVPNPAINSGEQEGTPIPMLVRVKTEDDADEVLAKIDDRKKLL